MLELVVDLQDEKERLDVYLAANVRQLSRSYIQSLINQGKVLVNGSVANKAGFALRTQDSVSVEVDLEQAVPSIRLKVIYEDEDCMVIDKPTGVLTHSKGSFNPEATIASFVAPKVDLSGDRAGIVHRLDRVTSGVIIVAKSAEALRWLQKQFSERKTKKTYIAVVGGVLDPVEAIIEAPIARNPKKPQSYIVSVDGKSAVTRYKILKSGSHNSLVELHPTTGRTHQLRVHMSYVGHPIVGDELYGGAASDRVYLHANQLEITLPSRVRKVFTSPIPASFEQKVEV